MVRASEYCGLLLGGKADVVDTPGRFGEIQPSEHRRTDLPESYHPKGKKRGAEALWRDFFSNPSQWWDHRPEKLSRRFPDFKHKQTGEALWVADARNPTWVQAELATISPGTLQSNAFPWTQRLKRCVKAGQYMKTMKVFHQMQQEKTCPDTQTFLPVLNACAGLGALEEGRRVHTQIVQAGCESDVFVGTCLVDMYAKCGSIEDAWIVFNKMPQHNVVSWSAMIGGFVKSGQGLKAIELFRKMRLEGVEPNTVTFVGVLSACGSVAALEEGRLVHRQIIQRGCETDIYVANCLVDMYAKCGSMEDAWSVFSKMHEHDVVSWSAMIGGYVKSGEEVKAMESFRTMQQEGVEPNAVTFVGVLNACASVAALEEGRRIHGQIVQRGCESDVYVSTCLVNMYAKCGSIGDAWRVFNMMQKHDVVAWNAMIGGYAMHGHADRAIWLFKLMGKEGIDINGITFTCLMSACSRGGLVKEGLRYFESMISCFNICPTREHYTCMVDLLGRGGRLEEAQQMSNRMPMDRDVWMSLLCACQAHRNVEMAEQAAKRCWELDTGDASGHVLLSNIYAAAGKSDEFAALGEETAEGTVARLTWIEVNNMMYTFVVNDEEHPQILEIHEELERLSVQMNQAGYIPDTSSVSCEEKISVVSPQGEAGHCSGVYQYTTWQFTLHQEGCA